MQCHEQEKAVAALQSEISELRSKVVSPVAQQRRHLVTSFQRLSGSRELQIVNVPLHDALNELEIQERIESQLLHNLERKYERAEVEAAGLPRAVRVVLQKLRESNSNLLHRCEQIESLIEAKFEERSAQSNGFVTRKFDPDWVRKNSRKVDLMVRRRGAFSWWSQFEKDFTYAEKVADLFTHDEKSWNERVDLEALVAKAKIPYSAQAQKAIRAKKEEWSEARAENKRVLRRILNLYQGVASDRDETQREDQALLCLESRHKQEIEDELNDINLTCKRLFNDLGLVQLRDTHRDACNKAKSDAKRDVDQTAQAEVQRQAQATEKYCRTLLQDAPFPTWSLPDYVMYSSGKPYERSQQSKSEEKPEITAHTKLVDRQKVAMFKFTELHANGHRGDDIRIEGRPPNAVVCVESGRFRGKNGPLIKYDATTGEYTARIGSVVGSGMVPSSQRQALAQYLAEGMMAQNSGIHNAAADHVHSPDNFKGRVGQPAAAASYTAVRSHELVDALIQEHTRLVPVACKAFDGRNLVEECKRRVIASLDSDAPTLGMLVLVDPSTGAVITHDAIECLQEDPDGDYFPWHYSASQKAEWAAQERAAVAAAELQADKRRAYQAAQRVKAEMVRACVPDSRSCVLSLRLAVLFFIIISTLVCAHVWFLFTRLSPMRHVC